MQTLAPYQQAVSFKDTDTFIHQLKQEGFCKVQLENDDIHKKLLNLASNQVQAIIKEHYPHINLTNFKPENYHLFCQEYKIAHSELFCKLTRYFKWEDIQDVFVPYIHQWFNSIFKDIEWVQEDNPLAPPKSHCYFRLVRPNKACDAPHDHCDVWGHQSIGMETPTIKFWMPLLGCSKGASFKAMPGGSHKLHFDYDPIVRKTPESPFNIPKLIAGQTVYEEEIVTEPPCIFVLHRKLMHGNMLNTNADTTRWSCEATAIVRNSEFDWL